MKKNPILLFFLLCFLLFGQSYHLWGQVPIGNEKSKETLFNLIYEKENSFIQINADFTFFKKHRYKRAYQDALVTLLENKKSKTPLWQNEAQIRTRGKFRCRLCDVPPIKIKLSKKDLKKTGFKKANELKLVLNCKQNDTDFQQLVYKEFLVYKLFNLISDYSFNVQIVDLKLIDSSKGKKYQVQKAFLVEDEEELAKRLDVEILDTIGIGNNNYSSKEYTRFQVFQYMIGNTDWIPTTCHNIQLLKTPKGKIIPVPFDFDFSGLVNAPYATPNSWTPLKNVRQRFFLGNDKPEEELMEVLSEYKNKRAEISTLIKEFPYLNRHEKKSMLKYVHSFFDIIDSDDKVRTEMIDRPEFLSDRY